MAMAQESVADLFVEDFYFSALFDEENEHEQQDTFTVSDAKYAEELQFQEALMASIISSQMSKTCATPSSPLIIRTLVVVPEAEEMEVKEESGESSHSFCEICAEGKENDQMFRIESCVHSFCSDCISKYVETKIHDNITTVTCPGLNCKSILEFDACKPVIPKQVLEIWEQALCEEMIDVSQRFYCPFKDCSAMLVNDNEGGEVIREAECPFCRRLFCAVCYVPWHSGVDCEEFQSLNPDERGREDLMVMELAKENKWGRCPHCNYYVERTQGCPHMTCRCNFEFCYGCESEWTPTHGGCQRQ